MAHHRFYEHLSKAYGVILLINHFIHSLNQFRSVDNGLDIFKINFPILKKITITKSGISHWVDISNKFSSSEFQKIGSGWWRTKNKMNIAQWSTGVDIKWQ